MEALLLVALAGQDLGEVSIPPRDASHGDLSTTTGARHATTIPLAFGDDELSAADNLYVLEGAESLAFRYVVTSRWPNEWIRTLVLLADVAAGDEEGRLRLERRRQRNRHAEEAPAEELQDDLSTVAAAPLGRLARSGLFGPLRHRIDGDRERALTEKMRSFLTWADQTDDALDGGGWNTWAEDPIHACYQLYVMTDDPSVCRLAHRLALLYRTRQILTGGDHAGHVRLALPELPQRPIPVSFLKAYLVQGLVDDYLVTGDPESLAAARTVGGTLAGLAPQYGSGNDPAGEHRSWILAQLSSLYEATRDEPLAATMRSLCDRLLAGQDPAGYWVCQYIWESARQPACHATGSGPVPAVCSPIAEGLLAYARATEDDRVGPAVVRYAEWLLTARTADGWGIRPYPACGSCQSTDSPLWKAAVHAPVFAFAFRETGRAEFREAADRLVDTALNGTPSPYPCVFAGDFRWAGHALGYLAGR